MVQAAVPNPLQQIPHPDSSFGESELPGKDMNILFGLCHTEAVTSLL